MAIEASEKLKNLVNRRKTIGKRFLLTREGEEGTAEREEPGQEEKEEEPSLLRAFLKSHLARDQLN